MDHGALRNKTSVEHSIISIEFQNFYFESMRWEFYEANPRVESGKRIICLNYTCHFLLEFLHSLYKYLEDAVY